MGDNLAIKDRSALEGMPLKLVIIAAMIALTIPSLYGALGNFQETTSKNIMRNQVEELSKIAQELVRMGPGGQRTVEISLPSDGSFIVIGGSSRSEAMSIGYGTRGGLPVRYYLTDPNVSFATPSGCGMVIEGPGCELCLRCIEKDGDTYVQVIP